MADVYISFDDYYDVQQYNEFITAAKNNKVEYFEYISARPPYNWYIKIDEKDVPTFINFEYISSSHLKFLSNIMKPRRSNEVTKLLRRQTDNPKDFEKFISPKELIEARDSEYLMFFNHSTKMK